VQKQLLLVAKHLDLKDEAVRVRLRDGVLCDTCVHTGSATAVNTATQHVGTAVNGRYSTLGVCAAAHVACLMRVRQLVKPMAELLARIHNNEQEYVQVRARMCDVCYAV
jgi:hypothetical protein